MARAGWTSEAWPPIPPEHRTDRPKTDFRVRPCLRGRLSLVTDTDGLTGAQLDRFCGIPILSKVDMDVHDIARSGHGCRSHSFKDTDHVGVLNLNVGGETAEPELASTTHDALESGGSETSSLAGILNDDSEIARRRPSDMQLC
jgi:hypothetical protein